MRDFKSILNTSKKLSYYVEVDSEDKHIAKVDENNIYLSDGSIVNEYNYENYTFEVKYICVTDDIIKLQECTDIYTFSFIIPEKFYDAFEHLRNQEYDILYEVLPSYKSYEKGKIKVRRHEYGTSFTQEIMLLKNSMYKYNPTEELNIKLYELLQETDIKLKIEVNKPILDIPFDENFKQISHKTFSNLLSLLVGNKEGIFLGLESE